MNAKVEAKIKDKISPLPLTRVERVADVGVAAHVFVQRLDPDDLGACGGQVGDADLISGAEEGWRVVVTVLHMHHYLHKVPLHRDLLITHLRRSQEALECLCQWR